MIKKLPFLFIIFLMIGCAGYKFQEVVDPLEKGQPESAYSYLQKHAPTEPDIPFLFELGLVAHYANHRMESSAAFNQATDIAEDRYTKSVSKEVGSLVTSDKLRPYSANQYERLLSHYYSALNYVYQGQLEGALVECRRATELIKYFRGEDEKSDLFGTPFLAYLSGMIFEADGEWNDAYISYKQAAAYYQNAAEKTDVAVPDDIGHSLMRLAQILGFLDELERYQKQYGEAPVRPENTGELIFFYESGYVPPKDNAVVMFPILTTDKILDAEKFAPTLAKREGVTYPKVQVQYLLRVAMPTIKSLRPNFVGIEIKAGQNEKRGILVADVENIAIETLNTQRPILLVRTLMRALAKYLTVHGAKKVNKNLGILANLVGVVTEQADTRAWQTLPNQIFMVRMPLPEGTHTLKLSFLDANGQTIQQASIPDVKINPNQATFLNYRTYK